MKVNILSYTPEPEKTVAAAARLCYSKISATALKENFSEEKATSFIQKLMDMGHMSPTEHVSFTFAIDGVSRTLLAQITRHRIASFSVQSLRYNNPFDHELVEEDTLSLENMSYLEGLAFSKKITKNQNTPFEDHMKKHHIKGLKPDDIKNVDMASYLRGVFDGVASIEKDLELIISFPKEVKSLINEDLFNTTLDGDKLLIKNKKALKFICFLYGDMDFIKSFYDDEKLLNFTKLSKAFKEKFTSNALKFIDETYYSTVPESISKKPKALLEYIKGLDECKKAYLNLVKMGINQEDARNILPMGTQTRIVMTMNVRSLYNFFNLRCCERAQGEIRTLANLMLKEVKKIAPGLFEKAGAPCEATGICPEGDLGCGKYPTS